MLRSMIIAAACVVAAATLGTATVVQSAPVQPAKVAPSPAPAPAALSLEDAQKIALASSPELAAARAAVDQAQANVDVARSSALPNLGAQAAYDRSKGVLTSTATGGTSGVPRVPSGSLLFTENGAAANLSQLILDGGKVAAQVASARFSTDASKLTLTRDVQTVLLTVAQQDYAALQSRHQLEAAQKSLEVARVQEKLVEAQYRAGVASKADVLTAQLPVAQAELAVAQDQNGEASNVAALLTTIGLPAQAPATLKDDTAVSPWAFPLDQAVEIALANRSDLLAARANLQAAQENVRASKLARFPVLKATASGGTTSTSPSGSDFTGTWAVGASLSFPIFDGGLIRAQTNVAGAQARSAQAALQAAKLHVLLNVQQAYLALATAVSGLASANVELAQAQVVLNVTNSQYTHGVTTLPLLLNAQSQLTKARSDQVNALYTYKIAQQEMLYAEGVVGP